LDASGLSVPLNVDEDSNVKESATRVMRRASKLDAELRLIMRLRPSKVPSKEDVTANPCDGLRPGFSNIAIPEYEPDVGAFTLKEEEPWFVM
jgi:hypothetical protein